MSFPTVSALEDLDGIADAREPRPVAPEADDMNAEAISVQPAGELDHLPLGAAALEAVHRHGNSRSIVLHDALPSGRQPVTL